MLPSTSSSSHPAAGCSHARGQSGRAEPEAFGAVITLTSTLSHTAKSAGVDADRKRPVWTGLALG